MCPRPKQFQIPIGPRPKALIRRGGGDRALGMTALKSKSPSISTDMLTQKGGGRLG